MAIVYRAQLTPTKQELLERWLETEDDALTMVGSYRLDDPAGEVGIEGHLARRDGVMLHLPLTYRAAPLDEARLLGTLEHSVLGRRWVYDATTDPVAIEAYARVLRGEQGQAELEVWEGDRKVDRREPSARISVRTGTPAGDDRVRFARAVDESMTGSRVLVATWDDGQGDVAALG